MMLSTTNRYIKRQESYGLSRGDTVKVLRVAIDEEDGWGAYWVNLMDNAVGNIGYVAMDVNQMYASHLEDGIPIEFESGIIRCGIAGNYVFPYFVLAKCDTKGNITEYPPGYEPEYWSSVSSKVDDPRGYKEEEF